VDQLEMPLATGPAILAVLPANNHVSIIWSPDAAATSYNIYRANSPGCEGTMPMVTGVSGSPYANAPVVTNADCFYQDEAAFTHCHITLNSGQGRSAGHGQITRGPMLVRLRGRTLPENAESKAARTYQENMDKMTLAIAVFGTILFDICAFVLVVLIAYVASDFGVLFTKYPLLAPGCLIFYAGHSILAYIVTMRLARANMFWGLIPCAVTVTILALWSMCLRLPMEDIGVSFEISMDLRIFVCSAVSILIAIAVRKSSEQNSINDLPRHRSKTKDGSWPPAPKF
jgi:hypothetical protein